VYVLICYYLYLLSFIFIFIFIIFSCCGLSSLGTTERKEEEKDGRQRWWGMVDYLVRVGDSEGGVKMGGVQYR